MPRLTFVVLSRSVPRRWPGGVPIGVLVTSWSVSGSVNGSVSVYRSCPGWCLRGARRRIGGCAGWRFSLLFVSRSMRRSCSGGGIPVGVGVVNLVQCSDQHPGPGRFPSRCPGPGRCCVFFRRRSYPGRLSGCVMVLSGAVSLSVSFRKKVR